MNWMIDGAHGDLYRQAMGYNQLQPHDEWEIERKRRAPALISQKSAAWSRSAIRSWIDRFASQARSITATQPSFERKVS